MQAVKIVTKKEFEDYVESLNGQYDGVRDSEAVWVMDAWTCEENGVVYFTAILTILDNGQEVLAQYFYPQKTWKYI